MTIDHAHVVDFPAPAGTTTPRPECGAPSCWRKFSRTARIVTRSSAIRCGPATPPAAGVSGSNTRTVRWSWSPIRGRTESPSTTPPTVDASGKTRGVFVSLTRFL